MIDYVMAYSKGIYQLVANVDLLVIKITPTVSGLELGTFTLKSGALQSCPLSGRTLIFMTCSVFYMCSVH